MRMMTSEALDTTRSIPLENLNSTLCSEKAAATYQIFWIAIITVILLCNTLLLVAMGKSWQVLRQNVVHRYLISCLLSVIAFCLLSAYEMLHILNHVDENFLNETVLQRYDSSQPLHRAVMQRYAYRKGLLPILAIVMQFNISVLIYAVSDNTYFVGRYTNPELLTHASRSIPALGKSPTKKFLFRLVTWKKHKPIFMCVLAWVAPVTLSIPVAFGWNCVEHCKCLPAYRWSSTCSPAEGSVTACSRTWLPVSQSFVIVITTLYWMAMANNFGMLVWTVRKFRKTHTPRNYQLRSEGSTAKMNRPPLTDVLARKKLGDKATSGVERKSVDSFNSKCKSFHGVPSGRPVRIVRSKSMQDIGSSSEANSQEQKDVPPTRIRNPSSFYYGRGKRPPLDRTIILLIVLTFSMFISVTPLMSIWFLDIVLETEVSGGFGFSVALSLSYIYAATLPFILMKYMSGLKKACVSFFVKCPCLHTTVVTKASKPASVPSVSPEVRYEPEPENPPQKDSTVKNGIFTLKPEES